VSKKRQRIGESRSKKTMKIKNEIIEKLMKRTNLSREKVLEALEYKGSDIRTVKTIKLVEGIVERARGKMLERIMKKMERRSLNELSYLNKILK